MARLAWPHSPKKLSVAPHRDPVDVGIDEMNMLNLSLAIFDESQNGYGVGICGEDLVRRHRAITFVLRIDATRGVAHGELAEHTSNGTATTFRLSPSEGPFRQRRRLVRTPGAKQSPIPL